MKTYPAMAAAAAHSRSEEHTSELQSHLNLVCRLLLEKKEKNQYEQTASFSPAASHQERVLTSRVLCSQTTHPSVLLRLLIRFFNCSFFFFFKRPGPPEVSPLPPPPPFPS